MGAVILDYFGVIQAFLLIIGALFAVTTLYAFFFILVSLRAGSIKVTRPIHSHPTITAVIAAKNEAAVLPGTLARLLEMPYPAEKLKIIVAVDEGDDATAAACTPFNDRVSVLYMKRRGGKPRVLNEVLPHINTDFLFLLDADSQPDRDAFGQMLPPVLEDCFIATSAQGYPLNEREGIFPRFFKLECRIQADLNANKAKRGFFAYTPGFCTLIRRSEILRVGGWDETSLSEDSDLALRIWATGGRISDSAAMVGMEAPARFAGFFRQRLRWYRGMLDSYRKRWRLLYYVGPVPAFDVSIQFLSPLLVALYLPFCVGSILIKGVPLFFLLGSMLIQILGALIIRGNFTLSERLANAGIIIPFLFLNSVICIIVALTFFFGIRLSWQRTEKSNYYTKNPLGGRRM